MLKRGIFEVISAAKRVEAIRINDLKEFCFKNIQDKKLLINTFERQIYFWFSFSLFYEVKKL